MSRTLSARKEIATMAPQKMRGEGERRPRSKSGSVAKRVPAKANGGPAGIGPVTAHAGTLIDLGKEMAAILPMKRAELARPTDAKAEPSKIVKRQRKEQPAVPDHTADSKLEQTVTSAGAQDGVALVGVVDRLARQLLSSAALVFTSLDAGSRGREQIEYRHEGAAGEWHLFAKSPSGLLSVQTLGGANGHHRSELALPCLKSSLQVVSESLSREVDRVAAQDPGIELFVTAAEEAASCVLSAAETDAVLTVIFETRPLELVATFGSAASALKNSDDFQMLKGMVEDLVLVRNPASAVVAMRWRGPARPAEEPVAPPSTPLDATMNPSEAGCEEKRAGIGDEAGSGEEDGAANGPPAELHRIGQDTVVVTVTTDKLDLRAAPMLSACLAPLVGDQRVRRLIVDLGQVRVMGSACLGILIRARSALEVLGRRLALVALNDGVKQVLEAAGLLSSFEVAQSLKDVISSRIIPVAEEVPVTQDKGDGRRSKVVSCLNRLAVFFS